MTGEMEAVQKELSVIRENLQGLRDEAIQRQFQCGVKLIRGQKGGVGWELHPYAETLEAAANEAIKVDACLMQIYGGQNGKQ